MQAAKRDLVNALVVIVFCGIAYYGALQIPIRGAAKTEADFFPKIIIGLLLFLAVCLLVSAAYQLWKGKSAQREKVAVAGFRQRFAENRKVILTFVIFAIYIFLLQEIGYFISSILFLFALYLLLVPGKKRYVVGIIGAVLITVLLFVVFQYGLSVYLPGGTLF
ncbi:tripartite tricarboxylate transporter TctB family protein [Edaphobacillus lindanitolerans]|uniref:Tripartite tricarboxylate transporter TctB family protein n=1 Tax=Edaphobacillus lindanitolerans TaxID=550447 RepID=A0A1U7PKB2_9BACI|nr:tripartite tricarboxylate transporter TctB family protein [Edaphobacillus lindanitolerans]SIT71403.1 Tripartite tricarboxylate transporter TctB family protein [Edaphobacillus lindanitolerans]